MPTVLKLTALEKPISSSGPNFWHEKVDGKEFPVMLQITEEELQKIYVALELYDQIRLIAKAEEVT